MHLFKQVKLLLLCGLLLTLVLVLAACGGEKQPAPEQQPQEQQTAQEQQPAQETPPAQEQQPAQQPAEGEKKAEGEKAAGDKVETGQAYFQANGCSNCHAIAGQGGAAAPDLSKAGSKFDAAGVTDFMKSKHPMPFQGSDEDLESLAQYLSSLK